MSIGRNRCQSRENRQRVRFVLNKHWDPIGIVKDPELDDEYDSYVETIYRMLTDNRSSEGEIENYLWETATGYIGVTPSERLAENCAATAAILVGLRREFETH